MTDLLCSDAARDAGDDPAGTASTFTTAVLLHTPGAWGNRVADEVTATIYGPEGARALEAMPGVRVFATRPPDGRSTGTHLVADGHRIRKFDSPPTLDQLRSTGPAEHAAGQSPHAAAPWTLAAGAVLHAAAPSTPQSARPTGPMYPTQVSVPAATGPVSAENYLAPGAQDPSSSRQEAPGPGWLLAVCTNGKRDRCCAILGRPLVRALEQAYPGSVLEISHLGGHRFAGTALLLPWGYSYGNLTAVGALQVAHAAQQGLIEPRWLRGRADLEPAGQAADVHLRQQLGAPAAPGAVQILGSTAANAPQETVIDALVLGSPRRLALTRTTGPTVTDTACGGKPFTAAGWTVRDI
ncbi:hypothetical protein GIS00_06835 [Nakamurella sp. YIM 132087]|uniref:Sucrase ferredoxin n=1 Tax=Nakamurella alba TaxID=2665158 RepID=A0A7K1FHQ3_9ACTN|nr:sucrase ferredoxin [Nakamurella alba]MTD13657.1 hypothetical protein [Nakamurella alba]